MLLLILFFQSIAALHYTLLVDTAVSSPAEGVQNAKRLKAGFDRYAQEQDRTTIVVFDRTARTLLKSVSNVDRERIHRTIDRIQWRTGCANWTAALEALTKPDLIAHKHVVFIANEDPCGDDPSKLTYRLESLGFDILAVGADKTSHHWLKRVSKKTLHIGNAQFLHNFKGKHELSVKVVNDMPLTAGEWVVVSIVILAFVIVFGCCCYYSCNREYSSKRVRNRV